MFWARKEKPDFSAAMESLRQRKANIDRSIDELEQWLRDAKSFHATAAKFGCEEESKFFGLTVLNFFVRMGRYNIDHEDRDSVIAAGKITIHSGESLNNSLKSAGIDLSLRIYKAVNAATLLMKENNMLKELSTRP